MNRSCPVLVITLMVISACASATTPSPSTIVTPTSTLSPGALGDSPSPSPIDSPGPTSTDPVFEAGGWPHEFLQDYALAFGPDGTAYIRSPLASGSNRWEITALDVAGHVKSGWPIPGRAGADFGPPAVGPDGSILVEECAGAATGCVLHRLDPDGRDRSGWPIALASDFACSNGGNCLPDDLKIGSDGTAFVSHWRESGGLQVLAVDSSGKVKPGWPVAPGASGGRWWTNVQLGADGTLFMLGVPDDGIQRTASVAAFGPNGQPRPGWPVVVPDGSGYALGPQGTVVVWSLIDDVGELCPSPRRTLYTVLGPDGRTLPGWPRGSTGHASAPVVDADGTLYYISATAKLYAHDRAGEVKAGWPVAVPGVDGGCGPASPYLAPDGTLFAMGDEIVVVSPDGRPPSGWPYRPSGSQEAPCFDSECFGGHGSPAFGPDGTVYLLVYQPESSGVRAEIVALDRQGQPRAGWPFRLPFNANTVPIYLSSVSPDGRVIVRSGSAPYWLLAIDPDGRVSR